MDEDKRTLVMLGRIDGKLEGVTSQLGDLKERVDSVDERLRDVEKKSVKWGAAAGAVISVGSAMVVEGVRHVLRSVSGAGGIGGISN